MSGISRHSRKTEIWPQPKTQCDLADFPLKVHGAVGFRTALGPAVCGGYKEKRCFVYQQRQWIPFPPLKSRREFASAMVAKINLGMPRMT